MGTVGQKEQSAYPIQSAREDWECEGMKKSPLTHLHEELSLLHHGFAPFAAFLDHPAAYHTTEHAPLTHCSENSALMNANTNVHHKSKIVHTPPK